MKNKISYQEQLIVFFKSLKSQGWIPYKRKQKNSDGLIGNIFEDLIGINENNKQEADWNGFEIKTKNKRSSSSFVSLFGSSIDSIPKSGNYIRENFGVNDEGTNNKIFNSTIKYDNWNTHRGGFSFKLGLNNNKLYLKIKNISTNKIIDNNLLFWDINKIEKLFYKIKNICYVSGNIDKEKNMVKYENMVIYKNANFNKFIELLRNGDVVIDFRIGIYKSGKKIGKTHDHGTTFRINKNKLHLIYDEIIDID